MNISRNLSIPKIVSCGLASILALSFQASAQPLPPQLIEISNGAIDFPKVTNSWGLNNISVHPMETSGENFIRVFVPKGAIDPGTMKNRGLPRGGAGFKSKAFPNGVDRATFSYWVRFPVDFDFVLGGKLPGLYGGVGNSGGKIPDGTDGFSFRLMWGKNGLGKIYAYLPSSVRYGTSLFNHEFQFTPGKWHQIKQEVILNTPGKNDGTVRLWVDTQYLGEVNELVIRKIDSLKINGVFFDVFFGGSDDQWAPKSDTHIDFSNFRINQ